MSAATSEEQERVSIPELPYSGVVRSGGIVAISGQVPIDAARKIVGDDFALQTRQVFANLSARLQEVGCTPADVILVNCYLADLEDFDQFNELFGQLFAHPRPARTTVQVGLFPGFRVEVSALAVPPAE